MVHICRAFHGVPVRSPRPGSLQWRGRIVRFVREAPGWVSTMALKATLGTPSERPVLVTVADEMPEQQPPLLPGDD